MIAPPRGPIHPIKKMPKLPTSLGWVPPRSTKNAGIVKELVNNIMLKRIAPFSSGDKKLSELLIFSNMFHYPFWEL
jgi:hypothetical protein